VENPDNLDSVFNGYVENQVFTNREAAQAGMQFIAASAHIGELSKCPASFLDLVKEMVGAVRVILGLYTTRSHRGLFQQEGV